MTWTITAVGTAGSSTTVGTPVSSLASGTITIAAGTGVAVFIQYTDFGADTITIADSASNSGWTLGNTIVDATSGEGLCSVYNLSLTTGISSGTITASHTDQGFGGGASTIQSFGIISFKSSIAGTPTIDGKGGLDNSTAGTSANSGAVSGANSGDLILTGIIGDASASNLGTNKALAITGVTTTTIRNDQDTTVGYADGSGVTTTTGSVTSTWSSLNVSTEHVVLELIFKEPAGGVRLPSDVLVPDTFRFRSYAHRGGMLTSSQFETEPLGQVDRWQNRGWDVQDPQPPTRISRIALQSSGAFAGPELEIEPLGQTEGYWRNRGWEVQDPQPPPPQYRITKSAAIAPIEPGNEAVLIPNPYVPMGWEPLLHQPGSPQTRIARSLPGAGIDGERIDFQPVPQVITFINEASLDPVLPQLYNLLARRAHQASFVTREDAIFITQPTPIVLGWNSQSAIDSLNPRRLIPAEALLPSIEGLGWGQVGPILIVTPTMPSIPNTTPLGTVVATITVLNWNGAPFTGTLGFGPPNFNDGGIYAIAGASSPFSLIIDPSGPGVGSQGGSIDNVTILANDLGNNLASWEVAPFQPPFLAALRLRSQALAPFERFETEPLRQTQSISPTGWEQQVFQPSVPPPSRQRFAAIAPRSDQPDNLFVFVSPNTVLGFTGAFVRDFQLYYPMPQRNRAAAIAPIETGIEAKFIPLPIFPFGWESILHHSPSRQNAINRYAAIDISLTTVAQGIFATLIPGVTGPITSFPISAGPITGGIFAPGIVSFPTWSWSQEPIPVYIPRASLRSRAGMAAAPGGEHPLATYHIYAPLGWEVQPPQPPTKSRRWPAIIPTGEQPMDRLHPLFVPIGWEIQPPTPPARSQPHNRFAAMASYEDGIENVFTFFSPNIITGTGWFTQDFQPPKFPGRSEIIAGMISQSEGIDGLLTVMQPTIFGWEIQPPHFQARSRRYSLIEWAAKLQGSPAPAIISWFDGLNAEPMPLRWSALRQRMMLIGEGSGAAPLISPLLPPVPPPPALVVKGYPAVPLWQVSSPQTWSARIGDVLRKVQQGKQNITLLVTLNSNATSTTVIDPRISATCALTFTPLTSDAAAILSSVYLSEQQAGQATLTHSNTANTDCTFTMVISG